MTVDEFGIKSCEQLENEPKERAAGRGREGLVKGLAIKDKFFFSSASSATAAWVYCLNQSLVARLPPDAAMGEVGVPTWCCQQTKEARAGRLSHVYLTGEQHLAKCVGLDNCSS